MAELNARIIAKASGTSGEVPQSADLEVAEVAVNTADGKFFTKHTDGTIKEISGGGAVDSVNGQTGAVELDLFDIEGVGLTPLPPEGPSYPYVAYTASRAPDPGECRIFTSNGDYLAQFYDIDENGSDNLALFQSLPNQG